MFTYVRARGCDCQPAVAVNLDWAWDCYTCHSQLEYVIQRIGPPFLHNNIMHVASVKLFMCVIKNL